MKLILHDRVQPTALAQFAADHGCTISSRFEHGELVLVMVEGEQKLLDYINQAIDRLAHESREGT